MADWLFDPDTCELPLWALAPAVWEPTDQQIEAALIVWQKNLD